MGEKNSDQSIMDKSMRSVFVGNIPYEATEEKLKEIFSEVGPVISLKLVFDRESGKPKGYGFCEYKDQETALSAMRNLNGYEIGGRTLRVDNACTEKSRMEMQQLLQGPQVENPYGEHCEPENAPEIITKTVASLPPEQMYELMKQMKLCIQNNPAEARQMLLLNPQLAYALLQAQVVMRIVDPQTALNMLFKPNQMPPILVNNPSSGQPQQLSPMQQQIPIPNPVPAPNNIPSLMNNNFSNPSQDIDLRSVDHRQMDPRAVDPRGIDPRGIDPRNLDARPVDPRGIDSRSIDPRNIDPRAMDPRNADPRLVRGMDQDMRSMPNPVPPPMVNPIDPRNQRPVPQPVAAPFQSDPRQRQADPRLRPGGPTIPAPVPPVTQQNRLPANGIPNDATDHEKAALIMQVLQLSDDQIAMLPPEQRASILVLKEQIAKSTQQR